jgi:hypothetical protein
VKPPITIAALFEVCNGVRENAESAVAAESTGSSVTRVTGLARKTQTP